MLTSGWKSSLRDMLPDRAQVPAKYWYKRLTRHFEPEMDLLRFLVHPGRSSIDVGGNRGVYVYELMRLGSKVEVFEPNPDCARILRAWRGDRAGIAIHQVALSDQEGFAELHIPIENGVAHDASSSLEHDDFASSKNCQVPLATLDSFDFRDVDFVKIDVEGHESKVLAGGIGTILRCTPALLVEIEQRHCRVPISDIFDQILGLGYEGYFLDDGRLRGLASFHTGLQLEHARLTGSTPYINNFIFLHSSKRSTGEYGDLFATYG